MTGVASAVRRHPLVVFFGLAYGLTWLGVVPYFLGVWSIPTFPFGPLIAVLVVTAVADGGSGVKSLLGQMVKWRAAPRWYAMALLLPLGVTLAAIYANRFFGAPDPTPGVLALLPSALPIFALALLSPFQGGLGEELGWRGFATPRLQARWSPLAASLILGVLVAIWHAPLFLTGLYGDTPLRVAFMVSTTLLFTLLYNGSGGSVLLAMLFHASWNGAGEFLLGSLATTDLHGALTLYLLGGIAVSAIAAVVVAWRTTRPAPRVVSSPAPVGV